MKFVCVGHSTFDTTLPVSEFPEENKKIRIPNHIECGGGPAANGAYLLAKWGEDVSMVSVIGKDYYGDRIIEEDKNIGIDTTYIEQKEDHHTSSSYIIANSDNGSRTILTSKRNPIRKLSKDVNIKADVILIDGEHPETAYEVLERNPEAISILDAGRLNDDTKFLGKRVTYFVCSKDYAEEFTNKEIDINDMSVLINIYEELKEYFKTNVIITLEAAGCFTKIEDSYEIIPSISVKSLDSTGAGDIFHGAFTYFIANNYSLKESLRYANITGAISVTRIGSRNSIPILSEVLDYDRAI